MALERIWLAAECMGLAFQPFAGPTLLARTEYDDVPADTGRQLREGWKRLTSQTLIMIFRIGHASGRQVVRDAKRLNIIGGNKIGNGEFNGST